MRCETRSSTAIIFAFAAVLVACGGSDDPTASPTEVAPSSVADTSAPPTDAGDSPRQTEPADSAPSTVAAPPATTEPARTSRWLTSVLATERNDHGWTVPPGTWTTTAFSSPVTFATSAELTLVGEYGDAVLFRDPSSGDVARYLYVARASFLKDGGVTGPVPSSPAEITELIESIPEVELLSTGETNEGAATWWDITVDDFANGAPYGCELGPKCGPVSFAASGVSIDTVEGEAARIYRTDLAGRRIGVYVTGPTAGREPLVAVADEIVGSLGTDEPLEPLPEPAFLGALGIGGPTIPARSYVARFPAATLDIELADELDDFSIDLSKVNTLWITTDGFGLGIVPANHLIDPTADQLEMRGTDQPTFTYVDPPVATDDEFLAWSTAMNGPPTMLRDTTIGGLPAIVIDDSDNGQRTGTTGACDPPSTSQSCYTAFTSDGIVWSNEIGGDFSGATAFIAAANLIVSIVAFDDAGPEAAIEAVAPVLEALTITPVGD